MGENLPRPLGAFTALAPDGSSMVYAVPEEGSGVRWSLFLKQRAVADGTLLTGTEGAQNVTYSPDGQSIVFVSGNALRRRPVGDGSTVALAEDLPNVAPSVQTAVAWLDDGTIVYEMPGAVMMRILEGGGRPDTVVAFPDLGYPQLSWAGALPGSEGVLVALCDGTACGSSRMRLGVFDFAADSVRFLVDDAVRGWYAPTGHLLYVRRDGAVFAAPFDLGRLELTGPGIPLFEGVAVSVTTPELVVARDGTMLYAEGNFVDQNRQLVWVDRDGNSEVVDPNMDPGVGPRTISLSPDGTEIALTATGGDLAPQLWVKELPDGPMTRLTTDSGFTRRPVWSPDGRTIAYVTDATGVYQARSIRADGSSDGVFDVLLEREAGILEVLYTRDGRGLVFREGDIEREGADLLMTTIGGDADPTPLVASSFWEAGVALSPDNRWMAYESDASGRIDVFVRPFPDADSRVPVSTSGGGSPVWAHNGRELFYVDGDAWLTVATYETSPSFTITDRERLFQVGGTYYREASGWHAFDVSPDDERFLMITVTGAERPQGGARVFYIQNFWEELKERTGG